jgi:hypothetical protein
VPDGSLELRSETELESDDATDRSSDELVIELLDVKRDEPDEDAWRSLLHDEDGRPASRFVGLLSRRLFAVWK